MQAFKTFRRLLFALNEGRRRVVLIRVEEVLHVLVQLCPRQFHCVLAKKRELFMYTGVWVTYRYDGTQMWIDCCGIDHFTYMNVLRSPNIGHRRRKLLLSGVSCLRG